MARFFRLMTSEVEQVSKTILEKSIQPEYVKKSDLINLQSRLETEIEQRSQEISNIIEQIAAIEQNVGSVISSLVSTESLASTNQQEIIELQSQLLQLQATIQPLLNNSGSPSPAPEPEPAPEPVPEPAPEPVPEPEPEPVPEPEPEPVPEPEPTISRIPISFSTRSSATYTITENSVTAINSSAWKNGFFSSQSISKPGEYFEFRPIAAKFIVGLTNNTASDSWKIFSAGVFIRSLSQFSYTIFTDSGSTNVAEWDGVSRFRILIVGTKKIEIQQETNGVFTHYYTITSTTDLGLLYPYGIMGGVPAKVTDLIIGKF